MIMRFFTMRLAGPVASLAGVQYDAAPSVLPVPTRSMITGMLGGAIGWSYEITPSCRSCRTNSNSVSSSMKQGP